MVGDACDDTGAVGAHVGVQDGERLGDGGRGAGRERDRAEDVDALVLSELES